MKWWESPEDHTYESIEVGNIDGLPHLSVQNDESLNGSVYGRDERPVFFGHYWLIQEFKPVPREHLLLGL